MPQLPRSIHILVFALLGAAILIVGCNYNDLPSSWAGMIDVPSGSGSGQPQLSVDENGILWMSWVDQLDSTRSTLRYASYDGNTWSEPEAIVSHTDLITSGPDTPSFLALPNGRFISQYLVSNAPTMNAYDIHIAQTGRDGAWQEPVIPHSDSTATQHGFASIAPWDDSQLIAAWLDGRETKLADGVIDESKWGNMTLRGALLDSRGKVVEKMLLDERVCDCCPTSTVRTESGALIAYRGRSDKEVRDIHLVQFDGEMWSDPYTLHDDGWQMEGCPVNGPKLASAGHRVAASWFTAADNAPRVKVAFSEDGGQQFRDPIVVDDSRPRGRVGIVLLDDGSALVSWSGTHERKSTIKVRYVEANGAMGETVNIVQPQSPAFTGAPQMVRSGNDIYIAWVDGGARDETLVRMTRLSVQDLKSGK